MVVHRRPLQINVVEAARRRLINVCNQGVRVYISVSGGKDSIVLADLTLRLIREGRIDPANIVAVFVDEEAMFDEAIRTTKDLRRRFIAAGVEFRWYCVEVYHFNCFNQLTNDETFICWDSTCPDRWVRPMPSFAITDHPALRRREENYQSFMPRALRDGITVTGVRVAESVQRLHTFNPKFDGSTPGTLFQPLYDWKDTDVWRYITEHNLDFPETYLGLYQVGRSRREMRISQFFSIDTAKVLVKLAEHDPALMDKIIRREPNAYLAALYWDTEMFRHSGGSGEADSDRPGDESRDFKPDVLALLRKKPGPDEAEFARLQKMVRRLVYRNLTWEQKHWKMAYNILIAGDPKNRTFRALMVALGITNAGDVAIKGQKADARRRKAAKEASST